MKYNQKKAEEGQKNNLRKILESEKHLINEPFFFKGTNGKAVLLIHGWTCTTYEVRKLGEFLSSRGYTVKGILLKGHGTKAEDLENVSWQEWLSDVEVAFNELKEKFEKVYIGGTSLGAVLAGIFSNKKSGISGIILMAAPYKLKMEWLVNIVSKTSLLFGKKYWKKHYPKSFGSSGLVTRLTSYQKYPTANGIESSKAIKEFRRIIKNIICPCFVLQSTKDHIVTSNSAKNIFNKIGSSAKKKRMIEKSYHTFIADLNNEHIFEDVLDFIDKN